MQIVFPTNYSRLIDSILALGLIAVIFLDLSTPITDKTQRELLTTTISTKAELTDLDVQESLDLFDSAWLLYYKESNRVEAMKQLDAALIINPTLAKAYALRGWMFLGMSKFDSAILNYNTAIKLSPSSSDFYAERGFVFTQLGDFEQARKDVEKGIELSPEANYAALSMRGYVYESIEDFDSAIEHYTGVIKQLKPHHPKNFKAIHYSNRCYARLACFDFSGAVSDYRIAVNYDQKRLWEIPLYRVLDTIYSAETKIKFALHSGRYLDRKSGI